MTEVAPGEAGAHDATVSTEPGPDGLGLRAEAQAAVDAATAKVATQQAHLAGAEIALAAALDALAALGEEA